MLKWAGFLVLVSIFACSSTPEEQENMPIVEATEDFVEALDATVDDMTSPDEMSSPVKSPGKKKTKDEIVDEMERIMRFFTGQLVRKFEHIRWQFDNELKTLNVPPKIQAVETSLSEFFKKNEDKYQEDVLLISEKYESQIKDLLTYIETKVWEIAFRVTGTEDIGVLYGSRTGIDDVDEIVNAALALLHFRSGLETMKNDGHLAKYDQLALDRIYKHDVEGEGRLSIFASESQKDFFHKDESVVAISITYQRKGLDPDIPLALRQVVRNRIIRGGTSLYASKFHWDDTLDNPKGNHRLLDNSDFPDVLVSKIFYPRLNTTHPRFNEFRDYTAVRDYKTIVINTKTDEIIDCVAWQYTWNISHFGRVVTEKGSEPVMDPEAMEIKELLRRRG